ncbi:MAG TPA: putative glycoside hydrolase [Dehalococcoidia bacterium]
MSRTLPNPDPAGPRLLRLAALLAGGALGAAAVLLAAWLVAAGPGQERHAGVPLVRAEEPYGPPAAEVSGTVTDAATGRPLPAARVAYGPYLVTAGPDGAFSLGVLPATGELRVLAPGYRPFHGPPGRSPALQPLTVRGVYQPLATLGSEEARGRVLDLARSTEINAVVMDVKGDAGEVHPAVATPEAAGAVYDPGGDLAAYLAELEEAGVYTIARVVCFRDSARVSQRPDLAVRLASGEPYRDQQGQAWVDAANPEAWDYVLDVAVAAAELGFDEVQFDYVRFPGVDSRIAYSPAAATGEARVAAIAGFLRAASARLWPLGVPIGIDTFGLTAVTASEQGLGQRIEDLAPHVDYLSPMVYPSTWEAGAFGEPYPAAAPAAVVRQSVRSAVERLAAFPHVRVRPWLQAFDDYGPRDLPYGPAEVREQIRAAEAAGATGWLLWHPGGAYERDALRGPEATAGPGG